MSFVGLQCGLSNTAFLVMLELNSVFIFEFEMFDMWKIYTNLSMSEFEVPFQRNYFQHL